MAIFSLGIILMENKALRNNLIASILAGFLLPIACLIYTFLLTPADLGDPVLIIFVTLPYLMGLVIYYLKFRKEYKLS